MGLLYAIENSGLADWWWRDSTSSVAAYLTDSINSYASGAASNYSVTGSDIDEWYDEQNIGTSAQALTATTTQRPVLTAENAADFDGINDNMIFPNQIATGVAFSMIWVLTWEAVNSILSSQGSADHIQLRPPSTFRVRHSSSNTNATIRTLVNGTKYIVGITHPATNSFRAFINDDAPVANSGAYNSPGFARLAETGSSSHQGLIEHVIPYNVVLSDAIMAANIAELNAKYSIF